jgi:hypothetical protein
MKRKVALTHKEKRKKKQPKNESGNFLAMIKTKLKGERNKIYLKKKEKRSELYRAKKRSVRW